MNDQSIRLDRMRFTKNTTSSRLAILAIVFDAVYFVGLYRINIDYYYNLLMGASILYNLVFMPTIRFTYLHHPNVNLYSGLGLGMDINGGSEMDGWGRKTVVGAAVQFTVIGLSANYERWFWFADFGGLYALRNGNTIFMTSSKIISAGDCPIISADSSRFVASSMELQLYMVESSAKSPCSMSQRKFAAQARGPENCPVASRTGKSAVNDSGGSTRP